MTSKFGSWHAGCLTFTPPSHLSVAQIRALLDEDGWNITFSGSADLVVKAGNWLPAGDAQKFTALTPADLALLDGLKAMRNFPAHRSTSSRSAMNAALTALANHPPLAPLAKNGAREVHSLGKHLRALAPGGMGATRLDVLLRELKLLIAKVRRR